MVVTASKNLGHSGLTKFVILPPNPCILSKFLCHGTAVQPEPNDSWRKIGSEMPSLLLNHIHVSSSGKRRDGQIAAIFVHQEKTTQQENVLVNKR